MKNLPYPGQVMFGRCASRQASPVKNFLMKKSLQFSVALLAGGESNSPCF